MVWRRSPASHYKRIALRILTTRCRPLPQAVLLIIPPTNCHHNCLLLFAPTRLLAPRLLLSLTTSILTSSFLQNCLPFLVHHGPFYIMTIFVLHGDTPPSCPADRSVVFLVDSVSISIHLNDPSDGCSRWEHPSSLRTLSLSSLEFDFSSA